MPVRLLFLSVSSACALALAAQQTWATDLAPGSPIVISEIGYNPPPELGSDERFEFVEIHNRSSETVDVGGWQLRVRGSDETYTLPSPTTLGPGAYLALARQAAALRTVALGSSISGDVSFSLGNGGDVVRLHTATGVLVDQVRYDDDFPWPSAADGEGATLERIDVADDRTEFINFTASSTAGFGSPGAPNSSTGTVPDRHAIVINEILYHPVREPLVDPLRHCADEEFIELFHRGDAPLDMADWRLDGGIEYTFPNGTTLSPGGYLVVSPNAEAFSAKYGQKILVLTPYDRQLANGGEAVFLLDASGNPVDVVEYEDSTPWPISPDGIAGSLELADPWSDNGRGAAWRTSETFNGTPGRKNSATELADLQGGSAGPQITDVTHHATGHPERGEMLSSDVVEILARVSARTPLVKVDLEYQAMPAGQYIPRTAPEFETEWSSVGMALDPATGLYAAMLPPAEHRTLVRYRVIATDAAGAVRHAPRQDDPEPNYAYFVYDGVPDYVANRRSAFGPPGFVHTDLTKVPVYHIIARAEDIHSAQYGGFLDNEYRWNVTFVHEGQVHDHCGIRLRGTAGTRFGTPKRSWKLRFNKGNRFLGRFPDGTPYPQARSKLNLMRGAFGRGGGAGAYETLGWRFYKEAGVITAATSCAHLRVVRSAAEQEQFDGDFFGIFLDVQAIDAIALRDNGRAVDDEARLYKFGGGPDKKHPDCDPSQTKLSAFRDGTRNIGTRDWYENNLDVERYLSFTVIKDLIDDDKDNGFNYFYYYNPTAEVWEVVPWDLDRSFGINPSGEEPLRGAVLNHFPVEFRNRFRFLWQTLYAPERIRRLIGEMRALVEELAAADIDRWDTEPNQACPTCDESPPSRLLSHATYDQRMRDLEVWTAQRRQLMVGRLLDPAIPWTPSNLFPPGDTVTSAPVRLHSSRFEGPDPAVGHSASRWLIIENGGDWTLPLWEGTTEEDLNEIVVPASVTTTKDSTADFLFRVAHQDSTGRWSLLSTPTRFTVGGADTTPPTPPTALTADSQQTSGVFLSWSASDDTGSGVVGYHVERDGVRLSDRVLDDLRFADTRVSPGARYEYRAVAIDGAGLASAPSTPLIVVVPEDSAGSRGGWQSPTGGFDYVYDAHHGEDRYLDARLYPAGPYLDGQWQPSSIDDWDGSAPAEPDGAPGGAAIEIVEDQRGQWSSVLTLEDPGSPTTSLATRPQNGRLLFLHPVENVDVFGAGVTLVARFRVHPQPRDLNAATGQDARSRGQLGLGHRVRPASGHFHVWLDQGQLFVAGADPLPVVETEFQALWITLAPTGEEDEHRVRVYLHGATEPSIDATMRLTKSGIESGTNGTYLEMGLANSNAAGAVQIDYFGYKAGVHAPLALATARVPFLRGDVNTDGNVDAADAVGLLRYVLAHEDIGCPAAADADNSGRVNLTDAVAVVDYALRGGPVLPPPFPDCGNPAEKSDPGATTLSCANACR